MMSSINPVINDLIIMIKHQMFVAKIDAILNEMNVMINILNIHELVDINKYKTLFTSNYI